MDDVELRTLTSTILARYQLARQAGLTFNGARDEYEVLGYDRIITNKQYREEYARGGIAGRVVDAIVNATWRGSMELIEDEDPEVSTPFEEAWSELDVKHQIQAKLKRVDKLACLSTYAVLLIGAIGDLDTELPRGGPDKLLYLTPFSGGGGPVGATNQTMSIDAAATVSEFEVDITSPRFGLPKMYQLKSQSLITQDLQRPVHWSRIIHIAEDLLEDEVFGQPALERVWNLLIDLRKVTGGGAEAFWLRANQGMQLDVDKDMSLGEAEKAALATQAEEYQHSMRRMLRTRGVTVTPLGSDVANFGAPADAILTQIAGAKGIPKRILTGSEMGELASSQDRDNWKDQVDGRQTGHAGPYIVRALADRFIQYGYLPTPKKGVREYTVRWPHIQTMTEQERADGAAKWAGTNSTQGAPIFTGAEIRDKWYGMEPLTPEQLAEEQPPAPEEPPALKAEEEMIRVLEAAIEVGNSDVVNQIIGLGGPGSGNFGHEGRPGEVGGSGGGDSDVKDANPSTDNYYKGTFYFTKDRAEALAAKHNGTVVKHTRGFTVETPEGPLGLKESDPKTETRPDGTVVAKSKYGTVEINRGRTSSGEMRVHYAARRKNGETVGTMYRSVMNAKNALREPKNRDMFPSGYLSPDVEWKTLEYKFSSTQIQLPQDLADALLALSQSIPDEDLTADGRETDVHITVKYGLHTTDAAEVHEALQSVSPISFTLGRLGIFSSPDYDVLQVAVTSEDLHKANRLITEKLETTSTHPYYQPHATVAYLKPGLGLKYVGRSDLDGKTAAVNEVVFASSDGSRTVIGLA